MRLLLDTCVVSELWKPRPFAAVQESLDAIGAANCFISVLTIGELTKGIALLTDEPRKRKLGLTLHRLVKDYGSRLLPVDQETAETWGELDAAGRRRGETVPGIDGLIAATAIRHGLHVATRNVRHFKMAGALVFDPWSDGTA